MKRFLIAALLISAGCSPGLKYKDILSQAGDESQYPGAHALVVFDSTKIRIDRDGTGESKKHVLTKILTSHGRMKYGEISFGYITLYDTVKVMRARVIKPDGSVIEVPEDAISDMEMPAWEGSKFFIPNLRMLKITFPGVEKGGAVEYLVSRITHNSPFDSTYDYWETFETTEPIREKVFKLSLPRTMKLKWVVDKGELEHSQMEKLDRIEHIWISRDVPKVVEEPAMPPFDNIATKLILSCTPTWRDYSRWYYELSEPKLKPDSEMLALIWDLLVDAKSKDDTIRALYEWVNKEVRYVETELIGKKGGFEPAPVSFTFKNRYGVCRDKAALLVFLLRAAGTRDTYMVLTNPILEIRKDIPCASLFNHAIVAIKSGEDWIYLDPTVEGSVEYLLPYEDGKPVLVCTPEGEELTLTPIRPPDSNLMRANIESTLDENGELRGTMLMEGTGTMDMSLRQLVRMLPKETIIQMFLSGMKSSHPEARIDSIDTSDPENFAEPMRITVFFTIPDYPLILEKEWHLFTSGGQVSTAFSGTQGMWNLEERKYPLFFGMRMKTISHTSLKFPKKLKVKSLPEPLSYEDEYLKYQSSYRVGKNEIQNETGLIFKQPEIPPEHYSSFKDCMEQLEEQSKKKIILEEAL